MVGFTSPYPFRIQLFVLVFAIEFALALALEVASRRVGWSALADDLSAEDPCSLILSFKLIVKALGQGFQIEDVSLRVLFWCFVQQQPANLLLVGKRRRGRRAKERRNLLKGHFLHNFKID